MGISTHFTSPRRWGVETHTRTTHLAFSPEHNHNPRHELYLSAQATIHGEELHRSPRPESKSTPALSSKRPKKMGVVHKMVRKAASLESQMAANRRAAPPSPMASPPAPAPAPASSSSSSAAAASKYPRFGRRGAPQVSVCSIVVAHRRRRIRLLLVNSLS